METFNKPTVRASGRMALLCAFAMWTAPALAGLKDTPPKAFDAASTGAWQIDAARSDDPRAILDKAREAMAAARGAGMGGGEMGGGPRGGGPGGGGPRGGGPGGGGRRGGGGGEGPRGQPGGPPGGPMEGGPGGGGPGSLQLLDDLAENFTTLTIERVDGRVRILSTGHSSTCSAGGVATFADSAGSGERRCGWSGAAWVVETKRGAGFKRTDRYEAASDGKTLNHLTTVVISGTPAIKISRTYVRPDQ